MSITLGDCDYGILYRQSGTGGKRRVLSVDEVKKRERRREKGKGRGRYRC